MPNLQTENRNLGHPRSQTGDGMPAGAPLYDAGSHRTDFTAWSRATLEHFARSSADECEALKSDLLVAIDAYRTFLKKSL